MGGKERQGWRGQMRDTEISGRGRVRERRR